MRASIPAAVSSTQSRSSTKRLLQPRGVLHEVALVGVAQHGALGRAQAAQLERQDDREDQRHERHAGRRQRHDPLGRGQFVHRP